MILKTILISIQFLNISHNQVFPANEICSISGIHPELEDKAESLGRPKRLEFTAQEYQREESWRQQQQEHKRERNSGDRRGPPSSVQQNTS